MTHFSENEQQRLIERLQGEILPNAYIIGAPKSGTTSLFRYLTMSKEVFGPIEKEPSYLSHLSTSFENADRFCELYAGVDAPVRLEATAIHLYGSKVLPCLIERLTPNSKVIVTLRNPSDRFVSFFEFLKHMTLLNSQKKMDEFFREVRERLADGPPLTNSDYHIDSERYDESTLVGGLYTQHLKAWHTVFGDRFRIYFFDDIANNPHQVMADLADFLEIEDIWGDAEFRVENQTLHPRNEGLHAALVSFYGRYGGVINRNRWIKNTLLDLYKAVNTKTRKRSVEQSVARDLGEYYADDLAELSAFFEEARCAAGDLPPWLKSLENA